VVTKRLLTAATLVALAGCALGEQRPPSFTGPSELALSLAITATPDIITQDGVSTSTIQIVARDANSQPKGGVTLRAEIAVGGVLVDFGWLSTKTVSTGVDGRAALTYVSPPPPSASVIDDTLVAVLITPVGSDYGNALTRSVLIRLARPGVIQPPNGTPVPTFFFSPTSPKESETVVFDGSQSTDDGEIVSYHWTFGDGRTGSGKQVFHAYDLAGTYSVVLTVTDNQGRSASTAPQPVVVAVAVGPTASFTVSPTDPVVGTTVFVNAGASKPSPGFEIVSYQWDFGDGFRPSSGPSESHAYTASGTYTIVLVVTDSAGRTASFSLTLTVGP